MFAGMTFLFIAIRKNPVLKSESPACEGEIADCNSSSSYGHARGKIDGGLGILWRFVPRAIKYAFASIAPGVLLLLHLVKTAVRISQPGKGGFVGGFELPVQR